MKCRAKYLLYVYLLTVAVFLAAKVVFMLCNMNGHGVTVADCGAVLWNGLSLDLSTALYVLIVPLLLVMASLWTAVGNRVFKVYWAFIATALAMAFVADTSMYAFWQFKLDSAWLAYLATPAEAAASVSAGYIAWRLLLTVLAALLLYWAYTRIKTTFEPVRNRLAASLAWLLAVPLVVTGIRGGFEESTTNVGQVYFSQNQFLNHAAVNPLFSFLSSFEHNAADYSGYDFFTEEECTDVLSDVYSTESLLTDTLLTTTRPANIVIVIMEGAGEVVAEAMPHLQQLKRQGVSFTGCYANSWRTDRGTVCALSGWPSFPNVSVMKMPAKSSTMPGVASSLAAEGYSTHFFYGGDINFTNMRQYLLATGWQRLTWKHDFTVDEQQTAKWGVADGIMFARLFSEIMQPDSTAHRLFCLTTLSSHEPWDVPLKRHSDEVLNSFAYLDDCLWQFVSKLRATPQWQSTLIVILPDHGINFRDVNQTNPRRNHIPLVWTGGAVRRPLTVGTVCNQSDLAATLLGQLQVSHDAFTFSRDVLSTTYRRPFAVNNYNNAQMLVDSAGFVLYDFDACRALVDSSSHSADAIRLSKAVMQITSHNLKQR